MGLLLSGEELKTSEYTTLILQIDTRTHTLTVRRQSVK